jgi:hypothetical protein
MPQKITLQYDIDTINYLMKSYIKNEAIPLILNTILRLKTVYVL